MPLKSKENVQKYSTRISQSAENNVSLSYQCVVCVLPNCNVVSSQLFPPIVIML